MSDLKKYAALKWLKIYTLVRRRGSAYIRGFAEEKAHMHSEINTEVYAGLCGRKRVYT